MLAVAGIAATTGVLANTNAALVAMLLLAVSCAAGLPLFAVPLGRLGERIPWPRLRGLFHAFVEHATNRLGPRILIRVMGLSVGIWFLSFLAVYAFFLIAGSIPIDFAGALFVFVAAAVGAAVPALPGGFGTYEAAVVLALRPLGYGFDEALAIALALHGSQIALISLLAPLFALRERVGITAILADAAAALRVKR